jgi:uncharacterized membrane protein
MSSVAALSVTAAKVIRVPTGAGDAAEVVTVTDIALTMPAPKRAKPPID